MLKDKCALVTGSVDGVGWAIAEGLADAGANVILNGLCDPEEGRAKALALEKSHNVEAVFDPADLRRVDEIERMVADAGRRFGTIDILVNNAVVRHFAPVEEFDPAAWDESIQVNLTAAFHLVRLALPGMKRNAWGRIINQASYYGWRGVANRIDYVTTKTALIGLTRAVAVEAARTGVTSNALCPGSVGTPAIRGKIEDMAKQQGRPVDEVAREYAAERNPMGRFVAPASLGALAVFLCGPAGDDINGAVLPVDGGWLAV
jgi:3-hydroxybutyrate dehydrogenase